IYSRGVEQGWFVSANGVVDAEQGLGNVKSAGQGQSKKIEIAERPPVRIRLRRGPNLQQFCQHCRVPLDRIGRANKGLLLMELAVLIGAKEFTAADGAFALR
ncbi:MAG: hypothetical protein Q7U25_05885, partial [Sulfuricella sp.]|nr:hypothetical protein [Sulfuricella sp.]